MGARGGVSSDGTVPNELTVGASHPAGDGLYAGMPRNGVRALGRERVSDIQRARMLTALVEVANERGAANVTVAHIVGRSGVSRRTFYEMFVDREACFLEAFDDAIQRLSAVVVPAYEEPLRWREKIRAGLVALLEFLDCERGLGRLVIVETLGAGAAALERRALVLDQIVAAVDAGRKEPKQADGPVPMTAEGVVGGVLAVLHSRLLSSLSGENAPGPLTRERTDTSLLELASPLMSMIVLPYLGPVAARRELTRPTPKRQTTTLHTGSTDPLRDLDMRLTYRTVRVLMAVAELGAQGSYPSNRQVGAAAGMTDQGQISKLLSRLHRLGLIQNTGNGPTKGAPNAWTLTTKGTEVQQAVGSSAIRQHAT